MKENELKDIFLMTMNLLSEIIKLEEIDVQITPFLQSCFDLNYSILTWPFVERDGLISF
jgi:hypothetical protein